jgi:hypothetical protein
MSPTELHETQKALDTLTAWGKNPNIDGGENINFSVSRQGAPSDLFLAFGDRTAFTPSGKRGTLNGAGVGCTGAPVAYFDNFGGTSPVLQQVPCKFSFNLNDGKVSLSGAFPVLASNLSFKVAYMRTFDAAGGKNILIYSDKESDKAGYVIAMQLVGAS